MRPVTPGKILILTALLLAAVHCHPPVCQAQPVLVSRLPGTSGLTGPNIDILEAVALRAGARLKLVRAPFKRALIMMRQGDLDIMAGLLKNPDRERYIVFVEPPYKTRSDTIFFVRKGNAGLIKEFQDLLPLTIGTTIGARYFPKFDRDERLSKEAVHKIEISFAKLLAGRLDTVISSEGGGIDMIHKLGIADRVEMAQYRFNRKKRVYIGLSRSSSVWERIPGIGTTLKQMAGSGEFLKIFQSYYTSRGLLVPAH